MIMKTCPKRGTPSRRCAGEAATARDDTNAAKTMKSAQDRPIDVMEDLLCLSPTGIRGMLDWIPLKKKRSAQASGPGHGSLPGARPPEASLGEAAPAPLHPAQKRLGEPERPGQHREPVEVQRQ